MIGIAVIRRLKRDIQAATAIEFGLLAPALILMMMGVLTIGLQMQNYNSARSILYDLNRYTVVEYQKNNELNAEQIRTVAQSIARRSPYFFPAERLDIEVEENPTLVLGAKKFDVTLKYVPFEVPMPIDLPPPTITKKHSIIVAS